MILSKNQELSVAQVLTLTGNTASTNIIDLGAPGTVLGGPAALVRDIGPGEPIPFLCQVTTAVTGAGNVVVQVLKAATLSLVGSTVVAQTGVLTTAQLGTAGAQIPISIVPNDVDQRYLSINFVTSAITAGAMSAGIVHGLQTNTVAGR